jgi:hypothetical protein
VGASRVVRNGFLALGRLGELRNCGGNANRWGIPRREEWAPRPRPSANCGTRICGMNGIVHRSTCFVLSYDPMSSSDVRARRVFCCALLARRSISRIPKIRVLPLARGRGVVGREERFPPKDSRSPLLPSRRFRRFVFCRSPEGAESQAARSDSPRIRVPRRCRPFDSADSEDSCSAVGPRARSATDVISCQAGRRQASDDIGRRSSVIGRS